MRTRFPFCSRYTLNPRLCASPPVFHVSTTRFAPFLSAPECAENDCSVTLVGAVMVSVCVEELFAGIRIGLVGRNRRRVRDHSRRVPVSVKNRNRRRARVRHRAQQTRDGSTGLRARSLCRVRRKVGHDRRQRVRDRHVGRRRRTVVGHGERIGKRSSFRHRIRTSPSSRWPHPRCWHWQPRRLRWRCWS